MIRVTFGLFTQVRSSGPHGPLFMFYAYFSLLFHPSGDCLDVHITNLVGPESSRMVRPVDSEHVETLKGVFMKKTTSFLVMAGLCDQDVDVTKLKKENMYQIETIGGNHTRIALQSLLAAGQLAAPDQLVKVKIYKDLSDTEALQVGYEHNQQALNAKQVTFMDVCRIIRKHLKDKSKKEVTKEKAKLSQIFGYEVCLSVGSVSYIHVVNNFVNENFVSGYVEVIFSSIPDTYQLKLVKFRANCI